MPVTISSRVFKLRMRTQVVFYTVKPTGVFE